MIGETIYKLDSLKVVDHYNYSSKNCVGDKCVDISGILVPSPGNVLVIIKDEIKWDQTTAYYANSGQDFYNDFCSLSYTYNFVSGVDAGIDKYNVSTMKNVTPEGYKDAKVYEVSGNMIRASKIDMLIKVRNKIYTVSVK